MRICILQIFNIHQISGVILTKDVCSTALSFVTRKRQSHSKSFPQFSYHYHRCNVSYYLNWCFLIFAPLILYARFLVTLWKRQKLQKSLRKRRERNRKIEGKRECEKETMFIISDNCIIKYEDLIMWIVYKIFKKNFYFCPYKVCQVYMLNSLSSVFCILHKTFIDICFHRYMYIGVIW